MTASNLNDLKYENELEKSNYAKLKFAGWGQAEKTITYVGGTPNAIGDFDGTGDPFDIFTVTGTVAMKLFAICTTTLTIAATATAEVGTAITTAGLIAQTAGDAIDVNEIWHDATPDASIEEVAVVAERIVSDDVIGTTATANINTGVIKYICLWKPITVDGNVVAA